MDLSFEKNKLVCKDIYEDMIDLKLNSFISSKYIRADITGPFIPMTIKKKNGRLVIDDDD
mgnify:CR=1 FL=1